MIRLRDILVEQSTAGAEARKRGLKSIGFGRYVDPSDPNTVVARSERGRLVRVQPQDKNGKQKKAGAKVPNWFEGETDSKIATLSPKSRRQISMQIDKLAALTQQAKKLGKNAPDYNLCKITIPGTNLYCDDNLGIPRAEMPQFKGKPLQGTPAEKLPKTPDGQVDTEPLFRQLLKKKGIRVSNGTLPSDALKATQAELVGAKVAGMAKALEDNPNHPGITAPIYVSRDGYVIDGHHRWAAVTSNAIRDGKPANMNVQIIDMDAQDIIPMANRFAEEMGVATKKAVATENIQLRNLLPREIKNKL